MKDLFGNHIETDEEKYRRKVNFAIKLLQSIPQDEGPVEISYSGGKDSDVILELAKMAGIPYRAIYKVTTIDPPGTIAHCKENGVEILHPNQTFFQMVEQKGWPTRRARFCCKVLKEYKVLDRAVQGIRRSESAARAERYKEPEYCRVYAKNEQTRIYLPILDWTDDDVVRFIDERGIKCHPLYYDNEGRFHVERRLGCLGCPMQSGNGIGDFLQYPKLLKEWVRRGKKYLDSHPKSAAKRKFSDAYGIAYNNLFCDSYDDFLMATDAGLAPDTAVDPKKFLEDYFKAEVLLETLTD